MFRDRKNLVFISSICDKNGKMKTWLNINWEPITTISSHKALSATNFPILFSKNAVSFVKFLFSYNPEKLGLSTSRWYFFFLDIFNAENAILIIVRSFILF